MKKLTQIIGLCLGITAFMASGCDRRLSISGTVIEQKDSEYPSYKVKCDDKKEYQCKVRDVICATSQQLDFHPLKVGDKVELSLNYSNNEFELPGKYHDGKFIGFKCHNIEEYKIIKAEKTE